MSSILDILDQLRDYAIQFPIAERPGGRLEVGKRACLRLSMAARLPTAPWNSSSLNALSLNALFGVPIVEQADLEPELWRLLDGDGGVINEGTLR